MKWLLLILACALTGCGPRKVIIYPIKGCDYWTNSYHTSTTYAAGPHHVEWPYGVKRCYPERS